MVLLGFEHPEIGNVDYKTSSPVQFVLARNLLYQATCQHTWQLEGLDLATAFLQTAPTSYVCWCQLVDLWCSGTSVCTWPRHDEGYAQHLYSSQGTMAWLASNLILPWESDVSGFGMMWTQWRNSRHHRHDGWPCGWLPQDRRPQQCKMEKVCRKIDSSYRWGTTKHSANRHAGTDIQVNRDADHDLVISVSQRYYVASLTGLDISANRLRNENAQKTSDEIAACRGTLGALQWLAIQTQPQLCARCNLLLAEVIKFGRMSYAMEIQRMIGEIRRESYELKFFKHKKAKTWRDVCFVTMADQANANRDKGDSTGGIITDERPCEALKGEFCPILSIYLYGNSVAKLLNQMMEVQAVLEGEDWNSCARLLWCEIHGAGLDHPPNANKVECAEEMVKQVEGVLCTDSKGGFDAVRCNESHLSWVWATPALHLKPYTNFENTSGVLVPSFAG